MRRSMRHREYEYNVGIINMYQKVGDKSLLAITPFYNISTIERKRADAIV